MPISGVENVEAILFDMNGTLRMREPHEPTQRAAVQYMMELLGKSEFLESYWEELTQRHQAYQRWAQDKLIQLSEPEIWTRWILPEFPHEQIERSASQLTLAWCERRGRAVPVPEAEQTIVDLQRRGYRLGIISNSMSTLDIPRSLDVFGWRDLFDAVILSPILKHRKPAPQPFWEAARVLQLEPSQCAYVGNRISKDIAGCKTAGFALGIMIEQKERLAADPQDRTVKPDATICALSELLEIFPSRYESN